MNTVVSTSQMPHSCTHLEVSGSQIDACTSNGLRSIPHKDVCSEAVIHQVPTRVVRTEW